jgi:charged multivesicular body protein 4
MAQVTQIEQQIYSIEAANINQETFNAMKNAGAAMKHIHGNLTIDKVDATMDELREHSLLSDEINNAITNAPLGEPIDEADLEEELEGLEQEAMDARMLKTGTVPVTGEVSKLPSVQNGPGESHRRDHVSSTDQCPSARQATDRRRGRRGRVAEVASRDGRVEVSRRNEFARIAFEAWT